MFDLRMNQECLIVLKPFYANASTIAVTSACREVSKMTNALLSPERPVRRPKGQLCVGEPWKKSPTFVALFVVLPYRTPPRDCELLVQRNVQQSVLMVTRAKLVVVPDDRKAKLEVSRDCTRQRHVLEPFISM